MGTRTSRVAVPTAVELAEAEFATATAQLEAIRAAETAAGEAIARAEAERLVANRAETERLATATLDKAAADLGASRKQLVTDTVAAQEALVRMLASAEAYTSLHAEMHAALTGCGLQLESDYDERPNGAGNHVVRARGAGHRRVSGAELLETLHRRVLGRWVGNGMDPGARGILKDVPTPPVSRRAGIALPVPGEARNRAGRVAK